MYDENSQREMEQQILEALIEENPFDVPEGMVESQVDRLLQNSLLNLVASGIDPKQLPTPSQAHREQAKPAAVSSVKRGLLLKAIRNQENIEVSDEEFEAGIEKRAQSAGVSPDHYRDQLDEHNAVEEIRNAMVEEKTLAFIIERADITESEPPSQADVTE
jgi:trigger factor